MLPGMNMVDIEGAFVRRHAAQFTPESGSLQRHIPQSAGHLAEAHYAMLPDRLAAFR